MVKLLFFAQSVFVGRFLYLLSVAGVLQCCFGCIVVLQQVGFISFTGLCVFTVDYSADCLLIN